MFTSFTLRSSETGQLSYRIPLDTCASVTEAITAVEKRLSLILSREVRVGHISANGDVLFPSDRLGDVVEPKEVLFATISSAASAASDAVIHIDENINNELFLGSGTSDASSDGKESSEAAVRSPPSVVPLYQPEDDDSITDTDRMLNLKYVTLESAHETPREIQIASSASLLELKKMVAAKLKITDFVSEASVARGSSKTFTVCTQADHNISITLSNNSNVGKLKSALVAILNKELCDTKETDETCNKENYELNDIHYVIASGNILKDNQKLIDPIKNVRINETIISIYGPKFLPVDVLTTWDVNFKSDNAELSKRLKEIGDDIRIYNWLLPTTGKEQTIINLKNIFAVKYLSSILSDSVTSSSLANKLEFVSNECDLVDTDTLRQAGIKSHTVISVKCKDSEMNFSSLCNFTQAEDIEEIIEEDNVDHQQHDSSQCDSRTVIHIAVQKHIIFSNSDIDMIPIKMLGITNCDLIFVIIYKSTDKKDVILPEEGYGNTSRFSCNSYWRDFETQAGEQTDRSMSSFLSSLFCFSEYLKTRQCLLQQVLDLFLRITRFPPAVLALYKICAGYNITSCEQALISRSCFITMKEMFPPEFSGSQIMEMSRVFFTFLITQPTLMTNELLGEEDCIEFRKIDLTCEISGKRITDPVIIRKAEYKNGISLSTAEEYITCCKNSLTVDIVEVSNVLPIYSHVLITHPMRNYAIIFDKCVFKSRPCISFGWRGLSTRKSPDGCLNLFSPLSLKHNRPPKLTLHENGDIVVYTGRGKGEGFGLSLFSPIQGELMADAQNLALKLDKLKLKDGLSEIVDIRKPEEIIVICLDVSQSMSSAAHFPDDDEDAESINGSDDDNWCWGKEHEDGVEVIEEDDNDSDANSVNGNTSNELKGTSSLIDPPSTFFPHDNLSIIDLITKEKNDLNFVMRKFKTSTSFAIMKRMATLHGADIVLREYVRLEDFEYPRSTLAYEIISKHYSLFVETLMTESAELNMNTSGSMENAEADFDSNIVPKDLMCPITLQLFTDPVIAKDGFTYERSAILLWFGKGYQNSPMTGLRITSTELISNNIMKSQVAEWLYKACRGVGIAETPQINERIGDEESETKLNIRIKLSGYSENDNVIYNIRISEDCTIKELKRFCIRITSGKYYPERILFKGMMRRDDVRISDLKVVADDLFNAYSSFSKTQRCIDIKLSFDDKLGEYHMLVDKNLSGRDFLWQLWESFSCQPSLITLWTGLKISGDGISLGHIVTYSRTLSSFSTYDSSSYEMEICVSRCITKSKYRSRELSRLTAVQQLFRAFIERTEAYDLPHHIALVLFGSKASCSCDITPYYDEFKNKVDEATCDGDTAMYDALALAREKLDDYSLQYPNARKRILCLSDGVDNMSEISSHEIAKLLRESFIICDSITIGPIPRINELRSISKSTGGYAFYPNTLKEALHLNELETVLSLADREPLPTKNIDTISSFNALRSCAHDTADDAKRKKQPMLIKKVVNLSSAVNALDQTINDKTEISNQPEITILSDVNKNASVESLRNRDSLRRIISEMRKLLSKPHPNFDIYPCEEDVSFWRLILQAPESTPYSQGCYMLYLRFPLDYPNVAPEVRFITPIFHCNINSQGRVCHSIFDRNWMQDTSISTVLDCIFGLLLSPDVSDPLDSHNALAFYDDCGAYEATIINHTAKHASKSRNEWALSIKAETMSTKEHIDEIAPHIAKIESYIESLIINGKDDTFSAEYFDILKGLYVFVESAFADHNLLPIAASTDEQILRDMRCSIYTAVGLYYLSKDDSKSAKIMCEKALLDPQRLQRHCYLPTYLVLIQLMFHADLKHDLSWNKVVKLVNDVEGSMRNTKYYARFEILRLDVLNHSKILKKTEKSLYKKAFARSK